MRRRHPLRGAFRHPPPATARPPGAVLSGAARSALPAAFTMTFVSEKMVKDMNVRGQLLLLMTTYIALDNTVGVSGICSANNVYGRQTCPDPQSALGAIAELDEGGELKIQVALSWGARPYGTAWRLRIQRTVEDNADALLLLAVPCADLAGTTTFASASAPESSVLCAFTALLAVRPGQNLWVWVEKLGRNGDLGCSFCEARPVAVLVLRQEETLPPSLSVPPAPPPPPPPPPPPACLHLGAVVAVSAAAALVVVAVAVLLCVVIMRRVALRQRLQKSSSAEKTNRQYSSRRTPEWTGQVRL
ncbi:Protein of unknown function [Gryllus bimaculatus]|nr:Protein of unknown function [Gryllus bimaculatus]